MWWICVSIFFICMSVGEEERRASLSIMSRLGISVRLGIMLRDVVLPIVICRFFKIIFFYFFNFPIASTVWKRNSLGGLVYFFSN